MASSQLPEDILLLEILPRLPAKSLLRLHCVCKAWHDLFKNPYFIHKNATRNPSTIYLKSCRDISELEYTDQQLFEFNSDNSIVSRRVGIPDHNPYLVVKSSSCNGILCLEDSETFDFHAETFEEMELCDELKFFVDPKTCNEYRDLFVAVLDDSLAVFSEKCNEGGISTIDVWVSGNNSSWTRKFSVELCSFVYITNVVGVHSQSLFLHYEKNKYVLVDWPLEDDGDGEGCKKLKARTMLMVSSSDLAWFLFQNQIIHG